MYELPCGICQENGHESKYVGETKRPMRLGLNEHLIDAQNQLQDNPMGDHFREHHSLDD